MQAFKKHTADAASDHLFVKVEIPAMIKADIRTREQSEWKGLNTKKLNRWETQAYQAEEKSQLEQNAIRGEIGVEKWWNVRQKGNHKKHSGMTRKVA